MSLLQVYCIILMAYIVIRETCFIIKWRKQLSCTCDYEKGRGRFEWNCQYHGFVNATRYQLYKEGRIGP
jgi:hypothetical protein